MASQDSRFTARAVDPHSEDWIRRLERNQQHLHVLIDSVKDYSIFTLDPEGRITSWSRAAEEMKGYREDEVLGKHYSMLFTPEDIERQLPHEELQRAVVEGRHETEGWRMRKDGSLFWANAVITALRDPTGRLWGFGKVLRDLSRRKWGEEERFAKIFRSSPVALSITAGDGRLLDVNESFQRLTGYSRDELIGQRSTDLNLWPDLEARERVTAALQAQGSVREMEGAVRDRGGNLHAVLASFEILDLGGQQCVLSSVQDISERKDMEQELLAGNRELTIWVKTLERRTEEITQLSNMANLLQSCLNPDEAYRVIAHSAEKLFPGDAGALCLMDPGKKLIEAKTVWGQPRVQTTFEVDQCWALRRGRIHTVHSGESGMLCAHIGPPPPKASVCVPMIAKGETIGVFYLESGTDDLADLGLKQALASTVSEHIGLALANMRLQETLRLQSTRDPLTGLFNRRYMEESLDREIRRAYRNERPLGVIMIDIDHFKSFNDSFGHEAGDIVLRELARLLPAYSRKDDIACRMGGEEFTMVLPEASFETTRQRAEQLRNKVQTLDVQHAGRRVGRITLSLGVAMFPDHGNTAQEILRAADVALYRAKNEGRNKLVVSDAVPGGNHRVRMGP